VFIAAFGYVNSMVLGLNRLVGTFVPVSVFGALLILLMGINPLLSLLGAGRRFRAKEIAVMVALMLVGCAIPSGGLLRPFIPMLVMPTQLGQAEPDWRENRLFERVPPAMMAAGGGTTRKLSAVMRPAWASPARPSAWRMSRGGHGRRLC